MRSISTRLKRRPALALLVDGIGAALSAFFLGVVLPAFESHVGMPRRVLIALALVALVYAGFAIGAYGLRRHQWRPWLRAMSWLNVAYCGVTAALVAALWSRLTFIGVTYFFLELLLIGALVVVERRVLAAHDISRDERRQEREKSTTGRTTPR